MVKTVVSIEGMMCPMCEKHVCQAITKKFEGATVTASHIEKKAEIVSEKPLPEAELKAVIEAQGYKVTGVIVG